jgi:hypothetical protein
MIIDRTLQREMLEEMRKEYPRWVCYAPAFEDQQRIAANLLYLSENGLCESGVEIGVDGHLHFGNSTISAAGLDFLADDGGLSAILRVVSVRLHADTIRELIAAKIEAAPIPSEERSALRQHLAALSETALKAATTDLVRTGLDHLPDVIHWLQALGVT